MKSFFPIVLTLPFIVLNAFAQESASARSEKVGVAYVSELEGTCLLRDNAGGKEEKLKFNTRLRAGQQISCKRGAHIKITFDLSHVESEITEVIPKWFTIPNVPPLRRDYMRLGGQSAHLDLSKKNELQSHELALGSSDNNRHSVIGITYLKDPVSVILAGTALSPIAHGEAIVERRKRHESEIDIAIEDMVPAYTYGVDYTTYVLWAINPGGRADNLGEFRLSGSTARLKAATPHQTFAMIVTAEPHYLVRLPSKKIILKNIAPISKKTQIPTVEVYFNSDPGKYYSDQTIPQIAENDYNKTPAELLQARRAVQIARLAEAERFDPGDFTEAVGSLNRAEDAFRQGASATDVGATARQAIAFASTARDLSEERSAAAERRAEIALREADVRPVADAARANVSESPRLSAQERLERVMREAAMLAAENRLLKSETERLREQIDQLNSDLTNARSRIADLQTQYLATSASLNETIARVAKIDRIEREAQQAEAQHRDFAMLLVEMAAIVTVKPTANGFVATVPDSFFTPNQAALHIRAKSKMDALGMVLATHWSTAFSIEGHADVRPNAESFALGRAQAVADYLTALGVARTNIKVLSRGDQVPITTRRTLATRTSNRRVELVFAEPH